jgi:DNA-binding beta-propeller fold protein YncE
LFLLQKKEISEMYSKFDWLIILWFFIPAAFAQSSFVNWENLGVHPLDMTPNGNRLLVTNTADNRLEILKVDVQGLVPVGSVSVGLDPVSVRLRTPTEAWVVNQISDTISIVDLATFNVVATLNTADEPTDVIFAGAPQRAFVSCSQANVVQVFDPANLTQNPLSLPIKGERPRSLAVSGNGRYVYVAIFESGNATTLLGGGLKIKPDGVGFPPNAVDDPASPYGGINPPPNRGEAFEPPQRAGNPPPPATGLIVRKNHQGYWLDDNDGDWTPWVSGERAALSGRPVGWDMPDHDLAVIDTRDYTVSYFNGLMNLCMAVGVNSASGKVTVIGTDATNEVRFEPNLNGRFLQVLMALVDPVKPENNRVTDLNPHLNYMSSMSPPAERLLALGDPRAIVWSSAGDQGYIAGMGSNNVIVVDANGARTGSTTVIPVGAGPIALALDESRNRLYVLNRFDNTISIVDVQQGSEISQLPLFDPTPAAIKLGRKHLYDTHRSSGNGHVSCASCHVDARTDRLAWDLGDPTGEVKTLDGNNLGANLLNRAVFKDFHPMKGPMTTQTLQDIIGQEPHHWRGDRSGIEAFNGAFQSLLGNERQLTAAEMEEFKAFLATIHFPPNPYRELNNSLPTHLPLPGHYRTGLFGRAGEALPDGNAQRGLELFSRRRASNEMPCVSCHTLPTGSGTDHIWDGEGWIPLPVGSMGEHHQMLVALDRADNNTLKVPQLRNLHKKTGFTLMQKESLAGFGINHDGGMDTLERFVGGGVFAMGSDQEVADMVAFLLAFSGGDLPSPSLLPLRLNPPGNLSQDTHAVVGVQMTLNGANNDQPEVLKLFQAMNVMADAGKVGWVAKGIQEHQQRGYVYQPETGLFQGDRRNEQISPMSLRFKAKAGSELTLTMVPKGTEWRIGVDRDEDGFLDRDELDHCADPSDSASQPADGRSCRLTIQ